MTNTRRSQMLPFVLYILGSLFFLAGSLVSLVQLVSKR